MTKHQTRPITLEELVASHPEVDALGAKYELSRADQMLLAALTRCCAAQTSPLVARQPAEDAECLRLALLAALSDRDDRLAEEFLASVSRIMSDRVEASADREEFEKSFRSLINSCEKLNQRSKWTVVFSFGAMLLATATFVALGAIHSPTSERSSNAELRIGTTLEADGELRVAKETSVWWSTPDAHVSRRQIILGRSDPAIFADRRIRIGWTWSWFSWRRNCGAFGNSR